MKRLTQSTQSQQQARSSATPDSKPTLHGVLCCIRDSRPSPGKRMLGWVTASSEVSLDSSWGCAIFNLTLAALYLNPLGFGIFGDGILRVFPSYDHLRCFLRVHWTKLAQSGIRGRRPVAIPASPSGPTLLYTAQGPPAKHKADTQHREGASRSPQNKQRTIKIERHANKMPISRRTLLMNCPGGFDRIFSNWIIFQRMRSAVPHHLSVRVGYTVI